MPSTYSTNLALELIGTGDQAGVWGNTTNTNLGTLIEQAISGYVTQAVVTGTDTTITIPNGATGVARNMYIELTGTGGTNTNLIVPSNKKLYFIFNNSTGAVTVKVSGQTGVSVPQGKKVVLASNGTDIVAAENYIADFATNSGTITQLTSTSASITTLTSSSATITNLTATSIVISNLSIASANITTLTSSSATISTTLALSGGTANGVLYLNASKVATSGSVVTYNGTTFGVDSAAVFNDSGANVDFRIEGDTDANLFFVDASADGVGIGTVTPQRKLEVASGSTATAARISSTATTAYNPATSASVLNTRLELIGGSATDSYTAIRFSHSGSFENFFGAVQNSGGTGDYVWGGYNGSSYGEWLRLTSSGNLGLGVSPSASSVKTFEIGSVGNTLSGIGGGDVALMSNAYYDSGFKYAGSNLATRYRQQDGTHAWSVAASGTAGNAITFTQAMTLDASGNLLVGATSGSERIYAATASGNCYVSSNRASKSTGQVAFRLGGGTSGTDWIFYQDTNSDTLKFFGNSQDRMALDTSGNLGVGTTSPTSLGANVSAISVNSTAANTTGAVVFQNSASQTARIGVLSGWMALQDLGSANGISIDEQSALPIRFLTNGSERARITSGGALLVGTTTLVGTGSFQVDHSIGGQNIASFRNTASSDPFGPVINFPNATPDNTNNYFLLCVDSTNNKCIIYSNGTISNRTGTYNAISDIKLKQDIVDAGSQWNDIKNLRVRKFRLKDEVAADPNYPSYIGLVAQETELVSPGLVDDCPDFEMVDVTDEDGNIIKERKPTGTITKSVKYSVLYMKAVKALQEAMARIEKLEAEVAAMKGA